MLEIEEAARRIVGVVKSARPPKTCADCENFEVVDVELDVQLFGDFKSRYEAVRAFRERVPVYYATQFAAPHTRAKKPVRRDEIAKRILDGWTQEELLAVGVKQSEIYRTCKTRGVPIPPKRKKPMEDKKENLKVTEFQSGRKYRRKSETNKNFCVEIGDQGSDVVYREPWAPGVDDLRADDWERLD